jgi:hypothetical protein
MNFWDIIGLFFWSYIFISYLFVLLRIIGDIFQDSSLNGWLKAVWMIFLVFVPFLTALVYLIVRGRTMNERQRAAAERARGEADSYIRSVATQTSPADEIAKAKALLESGSITQTEFESLKSRALVAA